MSKTLWNRVIMEEFFDLAFLTPEEREIIRTRAMGWSQTKQCHALHISPATLNRTLRGLKERYFSAVAYSDRLPPDLDF